MSTIHSLSSVLALPEFDIFGVPPTQLMVENDVQTEHRPICTITDCKSPVEFEILTGLDEYINLGKSELYLCLQVKLRRTNMAKDPAITTDDWKKIAPINYLLNTMFKQIKVTIGQTVVTSASLNYAYVSYMDALLNCSKEVKETHLQTAFWHKDVAARMDTVHETRSARIRPTGETLTEGCEIEMYGNLHIALSSQMKSLLGGVSLTVTLIPNDPQFYLMYDALLVPEVIIKDVRLFIHRSMLPAPVVLAHNKALEKG